MKLEIAAEQRLKLELVVRIAYEINANSKHARRHEQQWLALASLANEINRNNNKSYENICNDVSGI
jgi:hypothetical protein